MFRVRSKADRRWIENCDEEDGSFTENWNTGIAKRLQQHYGLMNERSIVGGVSTGNKGGRGCESNLTDHTQFIEPLKTQWNSSSS